MKQGSPTFGAFPEDFGTVLCCWTWGHSLPVSSDSLPSGLSPPSCTLSGCWSQEVLVAFARLWKVHVSCYLCSSCSCLWGRLGSFCYSSSLILCLAQEAYPEFSESLDSSCLIQLSLSQGRGENSRKDLKPKDGCSETHHWPVLAEWLWTHLKLSEAAFPHERGETHTSFIYFNN